MHQLDNNFGNKLCGFCTNSFVCNPYSCHWWKIRQFWFYWRDFSNPAGPIGNMRCHQ